MASRQEQAEYVIQDTKSGSPLRVKGYGALKGTIVFRKDIDLTRPIFEQAVKADDVAKRDVCQHDPADE